MLTHLPANTVTMGARKHNHHNRHKTTRVSRKLDPTKFKRGVFTNEDIAAHWDIKKTAKQNYEMMGLLMNPNSDKEIVKHAPGILADALGLRVSWVDLPTTEDISAKVVASERNEKRLIDHVSEEDLEYLGALEAKYLPRGAPVTDATASKMSHDLKLNWKQETAHHLATAIERMRRFRIAKADLDVAKAARAIAVAAAAASAATAGAGVASAGVADDIDDEEEEEEEDDSEEEAEAPAPRKRAAAAPRAKAAPVAAKRKASKKA